MMAEKGKIYNLRSLPGIQRDGTSAAAQRYTVGVWTRFQRGLPKKMNGYRQASALLNGPVRDTLVWGQNGAFYKTSNTGVTTALANPPITLYNGSILCNGTADGNGDFLVLSSPDRDLWKYNVLTDTWTYWSSSTTNKPTLGFHGVCAAYVSNYNVHMYVDFSGTTGHVWLYKHS